MHPKFTYFLSVFSITAIEFFKDLKNDWIPFVLQTAIAIFTLVYLFYQIKIAIKKHKKQ